MGERRAVLIAGPTASGKSALALARAFEQGGVIVNTDSMQVYDVLNVLTARPPAEDLAKARHFLYGFVHPSVRFSTGMWLWEVKKLIKAPELAGAELIFVGGTGLYFEALTKGFAETPQVPAATVEAVEAEVAGLDRAGRAAFLAARDPQMAQYLKEPDRQRVVRAVSVLEATGRSLAEWQAEASGGLLEDFEVERIVLNPDVAVLRQRIADRFEQMLAQGAVEEVKELLALDLDPSLPAMKAIGVREISDWLKGEISREEMITRAVTATRQYAKRQRTWFRNRMADWEWRMG